MTQPSPMGKGALRMNRTWFLLAAVLWISSTAVGRAADAKGGDPARGEALARALRSQQPAEATSSKGVLRIRHGDGRRRSIPVEVRVLILDTNSWSTVYHANFPDGRQEQLAVINRSDLPPEFILRRTSPGGNVTESRPSSERELFQPFAGTDFWIVDLGMAFLHWPDQRWVGQETRRTRLCNVLESRNPQPAPGAYLRVLTWVDEKTDGIVRAEAYDERNRLLKEFSPGSFAKVGSHYELREMEILNDQTDSHTTLEFQVDDPDKLGVRHLPGAIR